MEVVDESAAKAIVTEDPAVKYGVFVYEMHPWELKLQGEYTIKTKRSADKARRRDGDSSAPAASGKRAH